VPVIRVDNEVWEELKKRAVHLDLVFDSPNAVLRKMLGLEEKRKRSKRRVSRTRTRQREFDRPVLEALVEMGGHGSRQEVLKTVEVKMKDRLKAGDYELNRDGTTKWAKAVDYRRLRMVHKALLADDTPDGIWAVTDQGRQWLSQH